VVHVGEDTLGTSDLSSPLHTIRHTPGRFQAPVWLPDGGLVYAIRTGAHQSLVVDRDGTLDMLATFPSGGGTVFTVDPTGRRIAYRIDRADGTQACVYVQSVKRGGHVQRVTRSETTGFFWSPDGSKLLLMQPVPGAPEPTTHEWSVWDGERVRPVSPPFVPSDTFFNQYAPFFDQYAQSMTPWSPSSDSFAFAGSVAGQTGIWVARLDGSAPTYVDNGVMVSWLPDDRP
jgi:TolB protein